MPTQLNVEPVIRATEAEEGRAEVVWTYIQVWGCTKGGLKETEGTELRGVVKIPVSELSQPPTTILGTDLLLEETWGGGSDGSDSLIWKWFKIRYELDHQLYLDLAAMTLWVKTALRIRGGGCVLGNVRHVAR